MKRILSSDYTAATVPVIASYMALSFVFADFGISAVLGAMLLCLWTGICFLQFCITRKWREWTWQKAHWLVLAFNVFVIVNMLRNFSLDRTVIYYTIILVAGSVLYWVSSPPSARALTVGKSILIGVALLFSAVNLLNAYFPEQVMWVASRTLSKVSTLYNIRLASEGYGFSFSNDVGYTAHMIALGLALVWFSITEKNLKSHLPMLLLLAFGLIAMQRRSELLTCLVTLVAVTAVKWVQMKDKRQIGRSAKNMALPVLCIVLSFCLYTGTTSGSRFDYRNYLSADGSQTSTETDTLLDDELLEDMEGSNEGMGDLDMEKLGNGRVALWKLAVRGFLEKPVFGHGWRYFKQLAPLSGSTNVSNAHNVYLQLLCETGVVGFAIVGTIFVWLLVLIVQKLASAGEKWYYLLGLYMLVAMMVQGLMDNSLYYTYWMQTLQLMLFFVFPVQKKPEKDHNLESQVM